MSLQTARVQPRPEPRRPADPAPARRLQPVTGTAPRRRPRIGYAVLAVGGALAIGAAQMGISLATTQDAFVLAELNSTQHELDLQKHALQESLVGMSSPQALAAKADKMGLVVAGSASYLRLSDGMVLGTGQGADWRSTVDPNGPLAVGNALLAPAQAEAEAEKPGTSSGESPALPPTLTDGLPTPTTR